MNFDVAPEAAPDVGAKLMKVAAAAIEKDRLEMRRKFLHGQLKAAYFNWKNDAGIERIERDTPDWKRMMLATKRDYRALEEAKRNERNAERRLKTAISSAVAKIESSLVVKRAN